MNNSSNTSSFIPNKHVLLDCENEGLLLAKKKCQLDCNHIVKCLDI